MSNEVNIMKNEEPFYCNYKTVDFVADLEEKSFVFVDSSININGGQTEVKCEFDEEEKKEYYTMYSWGQNWSDQSPSPIENIYEYVSRHFKDIQKQLCENEGVDLDEEEKE